jgi:hypothetical protein
MILESSQIPMTKTTLHQIVSRARGEAAVRPARHEQDFKQEWDRIIDYMLVEWGRNPDQFDRDEVDPPTTIAIQNAVQAARELRDEGLEPPDVVVPSGDGGIFFRRGQPGITLKTFEFAADGTVEMTVTENCRLLVD